MAANSIVALLCDGDINDLFLLSSANRGCADPFHLLSFDCYKLETIELCLSF